MDTGNNILYDVKIQPNLVHPFSIILSDRWQSPKIVLKKLAKHPLVTQSCIYL